MRYENKNLFKIKEETTVTHFKKVTKCSNFTKIQKEIYHSKHK